jgi:ABC-type polysaccharide/polyol phosphate transport system ATPase subunit
MASIYRPTAGEVIVRRRVAPMIELGVGFQPDLTGQENA